MRLTALLVLVLLSGCASNEWTDAQQLEAERGLDAALQTYCEGVDYREDICSVDMPQGFGR